MRKFFAILIVILAISATWVADRALFSNGGANYKYLPFPVQQTGCGSALDPFTGGPITCQPGYVWWGIISSIVFWIIVLVVAYFIGKKRKTPND